MLHGLRKVLDLHHGYWVRQAYEVCVNALEHPLHIRTDDIVPSSPSSMTREIARPPSSYICIHMTGCHYVSSRKNMSFGSIYQKTQKKIIYSKNLKKRVGIRYQCHHMLILVVGVYWDLPKNLSPHRVNHRWQLSVAGTMERNQLGRG